MAKRRGTGFDGERWAWWATWSLLVAVSCASACAPLGGLSSGGDAGADVTDVVDATRLADARPADAVARTQDTDVADAPSRPDATRIDGGRDASGAMKDASLGDGCSSVPVLGFTSGTCPAAEAGSCSPEPVAPRSIMWRGPHRHLGACTQALAYGYYNACLGPASTTDVCNAFYAEPGGLFCASCLATDVSSTTFGPIFFEGAQPFLNTGGCVALVDPCNEPCAEVDQAEELCVYASCAPTCLPDGGETLAQYNDFSACANAAFGCSCLPQHSSAVACETVLETAPKTAPCYLAATSELAWVTSAAGVFCGTGAFWDAGPLPDGQVDGGG